MTPSQNVQLPAILIVDDLMENLTLLEAIISRLKVKLIMATSGEDALLKIQNYDLALAILDVSMPGMDGYELAVKINKKRPDANIPVIFITANYVNDDDLLNGYSSGAIDYIIKPFKSHVLLSKIKIFLDLYNQRQTIIRNAAKLHQTTLKLERTNKDLTKSEQKYAKLYDFAPSGYLTLSETGEILELNLATCQMMGRESTYIKSHRFVFFVSDDTKPLFITFLEKIFAANRKQSCKITLKSNGHPPVYVYLTAIATENKTECLLTMVDITDSRLAEDALKVSREKYKTMLNASPDGILLIDLKGIITEISEIGLELLSTENKNELIGKHFFRFIPPEEQNTISETIEKTMNEGIAQNIEIRIKKKNDAVFLSEISATLIQGPDGSPDSFMITIRDISQRKKLEKTQIHADRMASLGEMASGIAHEINQPLNTISLVMDNVLYEIANNKNIPQDYLKKKSDKIFENITRIRNIIDHVRAFSRNHDDYIATAFDINLSIQNAVSMISEQLKHLAIDLQLYLEQKPPSITGNTFKFEQVVLNLLTNAKDALMERKSKNSNSPAMFIEIKSYFENHFFVIEITDNGTGISEEDIEHIMLPFYTTKDTGKGTGLGLSISYQIIKEMNGTIEISGNMYHGTTFRIILDF